MIDPFTTYGDLFIRFHQFEILDDGKLISDAVAKNPVKEIQEEYNSTNPKTREELKNFFDKHFEVKKAEGSSWKSKSSNSAIEHCHALWSILKRTKDKPEQSSRITLPHDYVVPGGRFTEIYYWDSYFTMLGLRESGEWEMIESMIVNFAWMIEEYGHIPNGSRSYFLSRSQPPFFSLMIELLAEEKGNQIYTKYLEALEKEYEFWMRGKLECTEEGDVSHHVCKLKGGYLNRYFDQKNTLREEMYGDDLKLHNAFSSQNSNLFAHVRAACESGWDFSSRWFREASLGSINTLNIIPVDLNCLLVHLEQTISKAYFESGRSVLGQKYSSKANQRTNLIQHYCWNDTLEMFTDYRMDKSSHSTSVHAGSMFPLFLNIAPVTFAEKQVAAFNKHLSKPGGIVTTNVYSDEQWDAPNGWAPLQWIGIIGLLNYKYTDLALDIASRWTRLNESVFSETGKFVEKYNVEDLSLLGGGGEYELQDGFGWSNGVYLALKSLKKKYED